MERMIESAHTELAQPGVEQDLITELVKLLFEHLGSQIALADHKAHLTVAADAILVASIASLDKGIALSLLDNAAPVISRLASFSTILMFVSLLLSLYYALMVAKPILMLPRRETLFYFGNIQQWSEKEFIDKFLSQPRHEISGSILALVYAQARIANRKFVGVRQSINFLIAALILWALVQLLIAFT